MKKLTFIFVVCILIACERDSSDLLYDVDPVLDVYVDKFIEEAAKRDVVVVKKNLIAQFTSNIASTNGEVCGQCRQSKRNSARNPRNIVINNFAACWTDVPEQYREALVFHELGHCLLGRKNHRDDKLPNGAYASIMNTDSRSVYGPCLYALGDVSACNFTSRRSYYIDELFNAKTAVPSWGK